MTDLNSVNATEGEFVLGDELRVRILTKAAETEGRHDLCECYQPPERMTPLHLHTRYEERHWVLDGSMTVWLGDQRRTLRSGDFNLIPRRVPHAIRSGPQGCRTLLVTSPAGFAELIARSGTPAHRIGRETSFDVELFQRVTEELGDVVLGPPGTLPGEV
jgi:mannose-6-phosphate isomerase-like protein (cupin superfamily)